jgi:hypothetical protein
MTDLSSFLVKIAMRSAEAWHALGDRVFAGELSLETANRTYRFTNGVFLGRSHRLARRFDVPASMRGMRLIGFLADEGGLYSLSPRWRVGSHGVLWRPEKPGVAIDARSFVLTSPTIAMAAERPEPKPEPWSQSPDAARGRSISPRPPSVHLAAASVTRLHAHAAQGAL